MRFVIYKNSVLATICSMFGAACVAMGVGGMVSSDIGVLPGIGIVALGVALLWLAGYISERKAEKKRAKAARAASGAGTAQKPQVRKQTHAPAVQETKRKTGAVFAGILFLLAAGLEFWAYKSHRVMMAFYPEGETVALICAGILLMIAAFRTKHIQSVSWLYALGFLGLAAGSAVVFRAFYFKYSMSDMSFENIQNTMMFAPLLKMAAFTLMAIFALFSTEKIRNAMGSVVRWLWWVPVLILALGYAKWWDEYGIFYGFRRMFEPRWVGLHNLSREFLETLSRGMLMVAVFVSGICFSRLCKKPEMVYAQPQSAPVQEAPVQPRPVTYQAPVQEAPVQPQPEVRYAAPEAPKQTVQPKPAAPKATPQDVQKTMQAYKDLLDCGILSQEEYDQKIRELTRG